MIAWLGHCINQYSSRLAAYSLSYMHLMLHPNPVVALSTARLLMVQRIITHFVASGSSQILFFAMSTVWVSFLETFVKSWGMLPEEP